MLFFTIPSLDSDLSRVCGLTPLENGINMKRLTNGRHLSSPVKQPKCDNFSVRLDVTHFQPEDITIKVVDSNLIVEGKHGERLDESGFVSRQFIRRYELSEDIDLEGMTSKLVKGGQLVIEAPLIHREEPKERLIPITIVDQKTTDNNEEKKQTIGGA